jgi:hypothetical protein
MRSADEYADYPPQREKRPGNGRGALGGNDYSIMAGAISFR